MSGISCDTCGAQIKIDITGGSFLVKEFSTLDDINFEVAPSRQIITTDNQNADPTNPLTVDVMCSKNADHLIFDHTVTKVKFEIYKRIFVAAQGFLKKYYS